jgi:hypothetical protein
MRRVAARPRATPALTAAERQAIWRARRPERAKQVRDAQRNRKKALVNDAKAAMGCKRCGTDDPRVLDLHHRDPQQKVMAVSQMVSRFSTQRLLAEIAKCDAVCANCHRILHLEAGQLMPDNVVVLRAS